DGRAVDGFAFCASDISSTSRAHGALIDAGIAISASLDEERICREAARRTENLLRTDGIAIAMAEHGGSPPSLIHHSGYSETAPEDIERRLAPAWREAVESAVAVSHPAADGVEITVPLAGTEQAADLRPVTGAITVLVRTSDADGSEPDAEHVVRVIAAQTAAAMSRARQSRRREDERRLRATGDVAAGIAHELRTSLL